MQSSRFPCPALPPVPSAALAGADLNRGRCCSLALALVSGAELMCLRDARAGGAARLPQPLPSAAQTRLTFPRSREPTRRAGIPRSDTTPQLSLCPSPFRCWLTVAHPTSLRGVSQHGSRPTSEQPTAHRYGMISPVPGRSKHPAPVLLLPAPSSSLGLRVLRLLSALRGVCWAQPQARPGPLSPRVSLTALHQASPFRARRLIHLLFRFSKTLIQANRSQ